MDHPRGIWSLDQERLLVINVRLFEDNLIQPVLLCKLSPDLYCQYTIRPSLVIRAKQREFSFLSSGFLILYKKGEVCGQILQGQELGWLEA